MPLLFEPGIDNGRHPLIQSLCYLGRATGKVWVIAIGNIVLIVGAVGHMHIYV